MRRTLAKLVSLLSPRRADGEMTREIDAHLALLRDEFERQGMSPEDARRAAKRAYGGVEQAKEMHREERSFLWIEHFIKDVRCGARNLRRSPGFTLTAIGVVALGIGSNTAIFSIVNSVLLKPIPVPDPDSFVILLRTIQTDSGESSENPTASPAQFVHWRAQSAVLQDVAAFRPTSVNYTGGDVLEQWHSVRASADMFRSFGLPIVLGRAFTPQEDLPHGPLVAVITQSLWKRRFASDPQILGRKVSISGEPYTVTGVAADSPDLIDQFGDGPVDVYVPFQIDPNTSDHGQLFFVVARLKPGVTLEQAKERARASATEFRAKFPDVLGPKAGFTVKPLREMVLADIRMLLIVLAGAVGLVLLIACANVANLLLARGAGRRREIGIRVAVGAGRARVVQQLLTESVLLSLAGGALGLFAGYAGIRALLAATNAGDLPSVGEIDIDWHVLSFTLGLSLLTGMVFGLFPALQSSRVDLNAVLKDSGGRWGTSLRQNKARAGLVVSEVGLAVVLLVGSALLIRTFVALYKVDRGFETKNVVTMRTSFTGPKYAKAAQAAVAIGDALRRIRSMPGVVSASTTCCVPLQDDLHSSFDIVGRPPSGQRNTGGAGWTTVSAGYFEVFGIPVKRGRTFADRDDTKSPPVVVINESMAKEFWKGEDPLNDRIVIGKGGGGNFEDDPPRQIIGIVGDARQGALSTIPGPRMYVPQEQLPDSLNTMMLRLAPTAWVIRTQKESRGLVSSLQEQLRQATGLPVSDVRSMDDVVSRSTGQQRFNMLVMMVFGCSALLLAAIGIYGLMAYTVEQRTQEIGIRLALGADSTQLRNLVVRQGMNLALAGVVAGLGAAWGISRLLESLLFGVKPRDPLVFVTVPVALGLVSLLAVWVPARRALRVDPAVALRHD